MAEGRRYPLLVQTVLDCLDVRPLAEFYRELLGLEYRPGDESASPDEDWLVLRDPNGGNELAFQKVDQLPAATWPDVTVPQQLHLDLTVASYEEFLEQHERATALGARLLLDRSDDSDEPLRVYADPAGHPFCIFVASGGGITR
jgi:catechol 2,3-dioxygenase-like lactoylglutathione lyase family enzyme